MDWIGLLNICKLPGMSSHEVVSRVRRIAGMKRVGHTGTLDPSACGVLPICVGSATRLADYIAAGPKSYRAEFLFGLETATHDAEGAVIETRDAGHLREAEVHALLPRFTGTIRQLPPIYSAVQIGGVRAYDLARRGKAVELTPREVTIHEFRPVRFQPGTAPRLLADITCSKGTYIRSLARDLGEALGVGATLSFLARTQVGDCLLANAVTLDELAAAAEAGEFARWLQPPDQAVAYLPEVTISESETHYRQGTPAPADVPPGLYRVYQQGRFMGIGRMMEGLVRPVVNLQ